MVTRFKFFVYSAYVEGRTTDAVRVIAATKTRGADAVVCRLWLLDNRTLTVKARVKPIRENWNLKYSASYVLCSLRNTGVRAQETAGAVVAVLAEAVAHRAPTNLLPVLDTLPKPGIEENLHVCVKPFHYSYARDSWLVEWFELNRLLGASHFYMYNESLSTQVACVLDRYRREGLVTLLQWKLPLVSKVEIRTEGQFAAFNDCLYRSMSSAGWLLVIDVDEVVLPRRERTLPALLTALRSSYNPPSRAPSAFLFRNAFFYLRWKDDAEAPAPLLTARKTRRWAAPHAIKNRSKYALRPTDAVELGNHFIWELAPGASAVGVPTDRALLHHYRVSKEGLRPTPSNSGKLRASAVGVPTDRALLPLTPSNSATISYASSRPAPVLLECPRIERCCTITDAAGVPTDRALLHHYRVSKDGLRPSNAVKLGDHFICKLAPGASAVGVPTDRALLHHYRVSKDGLRSNNAFKLGDHFICKLAPGASAVGVPTDRALLHHYRVSKDGLRPSNAVKLGDHFICKLAPGASAVGVPTDRALLHHYRVSKDGLRPSNAVKLGDHFICKLAPGASAAGVLTDRALLHFTTIGNNLNFMPVLQMACEFGGMQCIMVPSTIDRTAHRWVEELMQRVTAEKQQLARTCPA
ncbi:hypothetical protein MSG28_004090 [Choristoneura fumiferana]|uniref:Uncharacterized protein n=1 Tax=Choristoneura fumiferana TaxID=7141 RepID=A0ACC0KHJ8_CHOFU|nr:hypothetical protein MSG28_004090 [Choristoneura fumiferana]